MTETTVVFDISMSLDGFITAAHQTLEEPMGRGGERLHDWAFGVDPSDRAVFERGAAALGAVICGRRTYDDSLPFWGADGPTGPDRVPLFVLSHDVPDDVPEGSVYTFVDGVEEALDLATAAAGVKDVTVMGGAETGRAFLRAGLVHELSIHLVPILLGAGTRLFADDEEGQIRLENLEAIQTPQATHLRFRVI
jgi:dihydrofolate reductase